MTVYILIVSRGRTRDNVHLSFQDTPDKMLKYSTGIYGLNHVEGPPSERGKKEVCGLR